jgi:hypothetical protein
MDTITSIDIFSYFNNSKLMFLKGKDVDLNSIVNKMHFNRQPTFLISICAKIVAKIRNNHFSFYDFKMYIVSLFMEKEKVNWNDIHLNDIAEVSKDYSNQKYSEDKIFIKALMIKLNLDISFLYKINADGNNILFDLINDKHISRMFYILRYEKSKGCFDKPEYDISNEVIHINKRTETLKENLRRK